EEFEGDYDDDAFTDAPNVLTMKTLNPGASVEFNIKKVLTRASYNVNLSEREFRSAYGITPFDGRLHNGEIFFSAPVNQYLQLIGGVNLQRYSMIDSTANPKDPHYDIVSPFATFVLKGMDGFYLEAGYRVNSHTEYGTNATYNISPTYWVANRLKIFTSFNTGFKAPTLSQLYGPYGANDKLKPHVSQSSEIGLNYFGPGDGSEARITYYRRKITDLIDYDFNNGYFNRDSQEDQGVEVLVNHKFSEKLGAVATYDFVTGKSFTISESG